MRTFPNSAEEPAEVMESTQHTGEPGVLSKELNRTEIISKQVDNGGFGWCVSPPSSPL